MGAFTCRVGRWAVFLPAPFPWVPQRNWPILRRAPGGYLPPSPALRAWEGVLVRSLGPPVTPPPRLPAFWATLFLGQDLCALGVGTWGVRKEGQPQAAD